jgi:hypothetical protein
VSSSLKLFVSYSVLRTIVIFLRVVSLSPSTRKTKAWDEINSEHEFFSFLLSDSSFVVLANM